MPRWIDSPGRPTTTIENYVNGTVSDSADKAAEYTFGTNNQIATLKVGVTPWEGKGAPWSVFWSDNTVSRGAECRGGSGLKVRALLKVLKQDGWDIERTRGSHRQFVHPIKSGTVTVSGHPSDDVHLTTLKSVLRQAGLE